MKYVVTLPALCLSFVFLYLAQAAEVCAGDFPVDTELAGIRLATSVDSAAARLLLLRPGDGPGPGRPPPLDCHGAQATGITKRLRAVTAQYSIDTATAMLVRCLAGRADVSHAQALFLAELARQQHGVAEQADFLTRRAGDYVILFVPGWGYLSSGRETGGDLLRPRQIATEFGFESHLVPLEDFGSVERNATVVVEILRKHLQAGKNVILASASSGGPAVALALGETDIAAHPRLRGWINICGVLHGSPIIDEFGRWPKSLVPRALALVEDWTYADLKSMGQARSTARMAAFSAPPQLTILNYIGIPFREQVSATGKVLFGLIDHLGPNDGLTLITDAMAPGYTIMALGSDHFINEDPQIDLKTAALLPVLLRLIEDRPPSPAALAAVEPRQRAAPGQSPSATQLP